MTIFSRTIAIDGYFSSTRRNEPIWKRLFVQDKKRRAKRRAFLADLDADSDSDADADADAAQNEHRNGVHLSGRTFDLTGSRGITIQDKLRMASIAQTEIENENVDWNSELGLILDMMVQTTNQLTHAVKMAELFCPTPSEDHHRWKKVFDLEKELKQYNSEMTLHRSKQPKKRKIQEVINELTVVADDKNNFSVPLEQAEGQEFFTSLES